MIGNRKGSVETAAVFCQMSRNQNAFVQNHCVLDRHENFLRKSNRFGSEMKTCLCDTGYAIDAKKYSVRGFALFFWIGRQDFFGVMQLSDVWFCGHEENVFRAELLTGPMLTHVCAMEQYECRKRVRFVLPSGPEWKCISESAMCWCEPDESLKTVALFCVMGRNKTALLFPRIARSWILEPCAPIPRSCVFPPFFPALEPSFPMSRNCG